MNKCLKIVIYNIIDVDFLKSIQKKAQSLSVEGFAKIDKQETFVVACGYKDNVEKILDFIHKESADKNLEDIEVEPHIKDKDYRGVFRIISE